MKNIKLINFLIFCCLPQILFAAVPAFQAGQRIKAGELKSKYRFSIGDFNGDNKKDILLISAGGDRAWVHYNEASDGAPAFGFATRILVNFSETLPDYISYTNSFQALDWDGDGDLDWLVADATSQPMLIKNTGSKTVYKLEQGNLMGKAAVQTAFAVDWNSDGKNDLILYDGTRVFWQQNNAANASTPSFASARALATASSAPIDEGHPFVVDWNNDGNLDLVACGEIVDPGTHPYRVGTKTVRLYLGTANPDVVSAPAVIPNVYGGSSLSVTDWDNDGKKDLLVMDSARAVLRLYRNQGSDAAPSFSSLPDTVTGTDFSEVDEAMQTQWVDWNHDGKWDAVVAGNYNSHCSGMIPFVKLYLNISQTGAPAFRYGRNLTQNSQNIRYEWNASAGSQAVVTDINNDGHWDLYFAIWRYSSGSPCDLFLYQGDATTEATLDFASETKCNFGVVDEQKFYLNPASGDLNGDGVTDLLFAQPQAYPHPASIAFYPNGGTASSASFSDGTRDVLMNMSIQTDGIIVMPMLNDLSGDGKTDVVLGTCYGIRVYTNQGTLSSPAFNNNTFSTLSHKSGGAITLPPPPGGIPANDTRETGGNSGLAWGAGPAPFVADLDQDGYPDLAVAYGISHGSFNVFSSELWWFRNGSGGGSTGAAWPAGQVVGGFRIAPNPFRGIARISLAGAEGSVSVFDLGGRRVNVLTGPDFYWDGRDRAGTRLGGGIYLLKAGAEGRELTAKIQLLR